ncbi:MAG: hypothetical protein JKY56_13825 [Kofleriaceae bacterium]|nr:hypothetical protein [Kofleriaceae bacterium]
MRKRGGKKRNQGGTRDALPKSITVHRKKTMNHSAKLVFIAFTLAAVPALAKPSYSVTEKNLMKKMQASNDKKMSKVNKLYGLNVRVTFDWDSFYRSNTINRRAGHGCESQIEDIEKLCKANEDGAAAVRSKIKELRCTYTSKETRNHKLVGSTIVESYWVGETGIQYYTQNSPTLEKWLGDNL